MTLRKMTVDNSVKMIAQSGQNHERDNKPNTIKIISLSRKQNKKLSQNNKKLFEKITAQRFREI